MARSSLDCLDHNLVLYIAEFLRQLEPTELHSDFAPSTSVVAFVSACRALRVSNVRVCGGRLTESRQCEQLLSARGVFDVVSADVCSSEALGTLVDSWSGVLQCLRCSGFTISDVSALGLCGSLHTLNLTRCSGISDVSALGQCTSLRTLDLTRCFGISDVSGLARGHCVVEMSGLNFAF